MSNEKIGLHNKHDKPNYWKQSVVQMLYYNINYVRVVKLDLGASDNMIILMFMFTHLPRVATPHMMLGYVKNLQFAHMGEEDNIE